MQNLSLLKVVSPKEPTEPGSADDLFELAPEAQLLMDPHADRLLAVNAAGRDLLGYGIDELADLTPSHLIGSAIADFIVFTQAVLEKGRAWSDGLTCRNHQGENIDIECHAVCVSRAEGDLVLATFRDQTRQQHRWAESDANEFQRRGLSEWRRVERLFDEIERENQLLLQAAGEGIYGLDNQGHTTFVNPAAERMLGYSADELIGKDMHSMLHHTHADGSHYPSCDCPIYAAFSDGMVHRVVDECFWRKDGSSFPVEYTSTPIIDEGHPIGAVVVFRDVSEQKDAEQRLHTALEELEKLKQRLEQENAYLQEEIRDELSCREILGRSEVVTRMVRRIELVAPTEAAVLITGESGTGKELIARAIHQSSTRSERPLIRVNCAAVARELFESEFFGHVKGAFTGAVRDRAGRFELADGGTLFLDEVGEIPLELQSKLLRVLQEGQFERVGDDRTLDADVRIIAATNRDLRQEVAEGRFREDLYFRLNVFPVHSASLSERPEDIPILASHFLQNACRRLGREGLRLSEADVQRMQAYEWPGNIRELENVLERAVIVSRRGQLRIELPESDTAVVNGPKPGAAEPAGLVTEFEQRQRDRTMIVEALKVSGGKVFGSGGAAELLGVKPTTLASRIKRWGIEKPSRD